MERSVSGIDHPVFDALREAAKHTLEMLNLTMSVNTLFLAVFNDQTSLVLRAVNRSETLVREGCSTSTEASYSRLILEYPSPILIPDTAADPAVGGHPITLKLGSCAFAAVPIPMKLTGFRAALCAMDRDPAAIPARDLRLMQSAAASLSYVLELDYLAITDPVTSVFNRHYLHRFFERTDSERRESFALMFLDIDDFKMINDTYGHEAGDSVLRQIAGVLQDCRREADAVVRVGGDEFLLLMSRDVDLGEIRYISRRICQRIHESIYVEQQLIHVTPSIGVSRYPQDGRTFEELLHAADEAMYSAKKSNSAMGCLSEAK